MQTLLSQNFLYFIALMMRSHPYSNLYPQTEFLQDRGYLFFFPVYSFLIPSEAILISHFPLTTTVTGIQQVFNTCFFNERMTFCQHKFNKAILRHFYPHFTHSVAVTGHMPKRNKAVNRNMEVLICQDCLAKGFAVDSLIFKRVNQHRVTSPHFI